MSNLMEIEPIPIVNVGENVFLLPTTNHNPAPIVNQVEANPIANGKKTPRQYSITSNDSMKSRITIKSSDSSQFSGRVGGKHSRHVSVTSKSSTDSRQSWDYQDERDFIMNPEEVIMELYRTAPLTLSTTVVKGQEYFTIPLEPMLQCIPEMNTTTIPSTNTTTTMMMQPPASRPRKASVSSVKSLKRSKEDRNPSNDVQIPEFQPVRPRENDREFALARYREKRLRRVFNKVRYTLRKQVSESRPRVKGRFIKSKNDSNPEVTVPPQKSETVGGLMENMSIQSPKTESFHSTLFPVIPPMVVAPITPTVLQIQQQSQTSIDQPVTTEHQQDNGIRRRKSSIFNGLPSPRAFFSSFSSSSGSGRKLSGSSPRSNSEISRMPSDNFDIARSNSQTGVETSMNSPKRANSFVRRFSLFGNSSTTNSASPTSS